MAATCPKDVSLVTRPCLCRALRTHTAQKDGPLRPLAKEGPSLTICDGTHLPEPEVEGALGQRLCTVTAPLNQLDIRVLKLLK